MGARLDFDGRRRALVVHGGEVGAEVAGEIGAAADRFAGELAGYGELIGGLEPGVVGFMVRGEGESFTARAAELLETWEMPPEARGHHRALAARFEHKRAFFKMEWHRRGDRPLERLAAFYYRRRPPVDATLEALAGAGLPEGAAAEIRAASETLAKETVHFVAAAVRPGAPVLHKLYFSQWVTERSRPVVERRIDALLERAGVAAARRARWLHVHRQILEDRQDTTIFVSFSAPHPGSERVQMKLDYPSVLPFVGAQFAEPGEHDRGAARLVEIARRADLDRLSYLGVRLQPGLPATLKGYADFR